MSDLPKLTEADIRRWTGEASFARGSSYFKGGAIGSPRLAGSTLKAQCAGSQPQPYRVQVTLGPTGIQGGNCSCPVGSGGQCKHAAALLLTWVHDPAEFANVEDMAAKLDRRSKAELIALIGKMVDRYPDLEMLIELPVPGKKGSQKVTSERIRSQVRHAFAGSADGWGSGSEVAFRLGEVVDVGDGYAESEDWPNAAVVYEATLRGVLEELDSFEDEAGDLREIANRCVKGLGDCLSAIVEPDQRMQLLRALFDAYAWDIDHGGIDVGYDAPDFIVDLATPDERRQVATWAWSALPAGGGWTGNFRRQAYGGFLLDLGQDTLDDEAWLRICRETGRVLDLVERLLALQRVDEARETAQTASDYDLLNMADTFKAHDHLGLAADLIRERVKTSQDGRLVDWLKQQALERGDQREALAWSRQSFRQRPSLEDYRQVKALAQAVGEWQPVQTELRSHLLKEKLDALLIEIDLEDGQIDRALETVRQSQSDSGIGLRPDLIIQVAAAAEETRPRASIRIYRASALRLIAQRGRNSYITAVEYLARVRELYLRLGDESSWQSLIAEIRQQNSSLRALKEELSRLGL